MLHVREHRQRLQESLRKQGLKRIYALLRPLVISSQLQESLRKQGLKRHGRYETGKVPASCKRVYENKD